MHRFTLGIAVLVLVLSAAGCGGGSPSPKPLSPRAQAIKSYVNETEGHLRWLREALGKAPPAVEGSNGKAFFDDLRRQMQYEKRTWSKAVTVLQATDAPSSVHHGRLVKWAKNVLYCYGSTLHNFDRAKLHGDRSSTDAYLILASFNMAWQDYLTTEYFEWEDSLESVADDEGIAVPQFIQDYAHDSSHSGPSI